MTKILYSQAFNVSMLAMLIGCHPGPTPDRELQNYLKAKTQFVEAIMEASPDMFKEVKILPIPPLTPPYEIGTPLIKGTGEPLTRSCRLTDAGLAMEALPEVPSITENTVFDLKAGLPDVLRQLISQVGDLRLDASNARTGYLSFSGLKASMLTREEIKAMTNSPRCAEALAGNDVIIIRGVIYGLEHIANTRHTLINPTVTLLHASTLELKYDRARNFELKDTTGKAKFWYVSERHYPFPPPGKPRKGDNYVEVLPDKETLDSIYSKLEQLGR